LRPRVSSELIPPVGAAVDAKVIAETARIHERAGFRPCADRLLLGCAGRVPRRGARRVVTERLGFPLGASARVRGAAGRRRKLATLDQLSGGRLAVHIIAGGSDADQAKDGDWTDHEARYRRAAEYVSLLRRTWTEPGPFDHAGEFYRPAGPIRKSAAGSSRIFPIYGGGGSDAGDPGARPACRCFHAVGRTA